MGGGDLTGRPGRVQGMESRGVGRIMRAVATLVAMAENLAVACPTTLKDFVEWYVDNRQISDGEMGGEISDDNLDAAPVTASMTGWEVGDYPGHARQRRQRSRAGRDHADGGLGTQQ